MSASKPLSLPAIILESVFNSAKGLPCSQDTIFTLVRRAHNSLSAKTFYNGLFRLQKRGVITLVQKKEERFVQLTAKGKVEVLLIKARYAKATTEPWDGKWRMVIFDIPEATRDQRDILRVLLKQNGFFKLQASVFVHPHPLNREAIEYLKATGLIKYIRFARMEEIDDDADLRRAFKLHKL